ncbi:MAG: InlB B-repeat-containing protein [Lachnospiraceae bacterium]|nr:InlB B-repeat-containing protein [Lachnospiraceae bacterium]
MIGNDSYLNIGSGTSKIYSPIATAANVKTYGVYSTKDIFIRQLAGTTFNENNYFDDIIITPDVSVTERAGTIMNTGFIKSTEVAEKSFKASTYSNAYFKAYKGRNNNVVIGVRKVNFDFNVPAGKTIATNSYPEYKLIGGATISKIDKATFKVDGYAFMGWTFERKDPSSTTSVDVRNGGNLDTPFGTNELSGEWTLYALWGNHRHKVCGTATNSECDHDNVHLGTHSEILTYEELTEETTFVSGGAYYLTSDLEINRTINVTGTVYICLNGFTLNNVAFIGTSADSAVYICNCQESEANMTQIDSVEELFRDMHTYMYSVGGRINASTKMINHRLNAGYNFEAYNVLFKPVDGFVYTVTDGSLTGQNDAYRNKTIFSNVIITGYTTTCLISDNSADATVNGYFGLFDSVITGNNITGRGIIMNGGGKFDVENTIISNNELRPSAAGSAIGIHQRNATGIMNISSTSVVNNIYVPSGAVHARLIYTNGGTINISSSSIANNNVTHIFDHDTGYLTLNDVKINSNTINNNIIHQVGGNIKIDKSSINNNVVNEYAINSRNGSFIISSSEMSENTINDIAINLTNSRFTAEKVDIKESTMSNILKAVSGSVVIASASHISSNRVLANKHSTETTNEAIDINNSTFDVYGDSSVDNTISSARSIIYVSASSTLNIKKDAKFVFASNSTQLHVLAMTASSVNVEEDGTLEFSGNIVKSLDANTIEAIYDNDGTSTANIYGNLTIINNEFEDTNGLTNVATSFRNPNNSTLKIGNGKVLIHDIKPSREADKDVNHYGLYSAMNSFMTQATGTSFNEENYIENVALSSGTGIVMANDNFVKDTLVAEKSFKASTISNANYKAYKGNRNNVVIGIRKVNFDFNAPVGKVVATNSYPEYKLVGGATLSHIDRATMTTDGYFFLGWTYDRREATTSALAKADIRDGGYLDTAFGADECNQEWTLYAYWGTHTHKICGLASGSECNHDAGYTSSHTKVISYEPFKATMSTLTSGKGYVLTSDCNVNRTYTIAGTVYLCLNGYALNNVAFTGTDANSAIYICNCSTEEANVTQLSSQNNLFEDINTYVYGTGARINFTTKYINRRQTCGDFEVYNAKFVPIAGWTNVGSVEQYAIVDEGTNNILKRTTFSNVVLDGYTTRILVSNNGSNTNNTFTIHNSEFINNTVITSDGTSNASGIIYNTAGKYNIDNIKISGNNFEGNNKAAINQPGGLGSINIKNSIIDNNRSTGTSATTRPYLLNAGQGKINVSSISITNNTNIEKLINSVNSSVNIDRAYIYNNTFRGAVIEIDAQSVLNMSNINMTSNTSNIRYLYNSGTATISDMVFDNNKVTSATGTDSRSIFDNYKILTIDRATFSNLTTTAHLLHSDSTDSFTGKNINIINNTVQNDLFNIADNSFKLEDVVIKDNNIINNLVNVRSGARTVEFNNVDIKNNTVQLHLIYQATGTFNIKNTNIENNIVNRRIAYVSGSTLNMEKVSIDNNTTYNGALYATENSFVKASASTITNNTTTYTGDDGSNFILIEKSTMTVYGNSEILNNDASSLGNASVIKVVSRAASRTAELKIEDGGSLKIASNSITKYSILNVAEYGKLSINENADAQITKNVVKVVDDSTSCVRLQETNSKIDAYGSLIIKDNYYSYAGTNSYDVSALRVSLAATARFNIGSKKVQIYKMLPYEGMTTTLKPYGMYSTIQSFMTQLPGTTFNEENYFEDIALSSGTGIVMANNNFIKDTLVAERSFKAATYSNADYRAYKGANQNVVIGIRKIKYDFNAPEGKTIATNSYPEYKYVGGATVSKIDKATFTADGYTFLGWTKDRRKATTSISHNVDVKDGGNFDTAFGTDELNEEWTLYAYWGTHTHKACGTEAGVECNHDNEHIGSHTDVIYYEPLLDTMTTLESGKGYYLTSTASVARAFNIAGTVYICLNGYALKNVAFRGNSSNDKVYICNCSSDEAAVTQHPDASNDVMFYNLTAKIYGTGNKINFTTKYLAIREYANDFEAYNAYFTGVSGWSPATSATHQAVFDGASNAYERHATLSNVTFEGYRSDVIVSNISGSQNSTLYINNSKIINNEITGAGGIYNTNGIYTINNTLINNNTITDTYTLIRQNNFASGKINIYNSKIENNNESGIRNSLLIYCEAGTINISTVSIVNNKSAYVMRIAEAGAKMDVNNVTIKDNTVNAYLIRNNHASATFNLSNADIKDNNSSEYFIYNEGTMSIKDSRIDNNNDTAHTLVYTIRALTLDNVKFTNNNSSNSLLKTNSGAILNVKNSVIASNSTTDPIIYNGNDGAATLTLENADIYNNRVPAGTDKSIIHSERSGGSVTFKGDNNIYKNSSTKIISIDRHNINFENSNTKIYENEAEEQLVIVMDANTNIDASSTLDISNNTTRRISGSSSFLSIGNSTAGSSIVNVLGNLNIIGNTVLVDSDYTPTAINASPAGLYTGLRTQVYMGNGAIKVYGNTITDDTKRFNKMYQWYSKNVNPYIFQTAGTTFNEETLIDGIGYINGTGTIVANDNFIKDNEVAEKSFIAATYSEYFANGADFRAYKGADNNVVIGIRKVYFDKNIPAGQHITKGNIATMNIAGKVSVTLPEVTMSTEDYELIGWSYAPQTPDPTGAVVPAVDIANGGTFDMPITEVEKTLYAVWFKDCIVIDYNPSTPSSVRSEYKNELTSELKKATMSLLLKTKGTISIIESPYTIDGYTFKGWALTPVGRVEADTYVLDATYQPNNIVTYDDMLAAHPSKTVNLYAVWVRDTYKVTIHANDVREGNGTSTGSLNGLTTVTKTFDMRYDSTFEEVGGSGSAGASPLLPTNGSRTGYTYNGEWAKTKNIRIEDRASWSETHATDVYKNDSVYRLATESILYANWINKKYNVTLHANDDREGDGNTRGSIIAGDIATVSYPIYYDATMSFVPKNGTRTGYTYGGVTLAKVLIKNRKKAPTVATATSLYNYESDRDLYVNWINNEFKLIVDLNDGKAGTLKTGDELIAYYDAVYPFKWKEGASDIYDKVIDTPTKAYSEFHFFVEEANKNVATWSDLLTKAEHDNLYALYAVGKDICTLTSDQEIAAWFSPSKFDVELDGNGGTFNKKSIMTLNVPYTYEGGYASSSYVIPNPSYTGFKFLGWQKDGSSVIVDSKDLYNTDWFMYDAGESEHTLKATYSEISYNIKYAMSKLPKGGTGTLPASISNVKFTTRVSIVSGSFNLSGNMEFSGWTVANGYKRGTFIKKNSLPYGISGLGSSDGETIILEATFRDNKGGGGKRGGGSGGGGGGTIGGGGGTGYWYYDFTGWSYYTINPTTMKSERLMDGLYKLRYKEYEPKYYGFENGYMVTGFHNFYGHTYYFNENPYTAEYGAMVFGNVTLNGILFIMDHEIGELVEVVTTSPYENDYTSKWVVSWFNDPLSNTTLLVANDGVKVVGLQGAIGLNGIWYVFDDHSIMQKGIIYYRGYYYYLSLDGDFIGAVLPIEIIVDGVSLDFREVGTGKLQNPENIELLTTVKPKEINGQIGIEKAKVA